MNSQNLNYCYYVEYFEGNDINFLQPDSCEDALKRKNKALTDHCVKREQLMSPVPEELAPHAVELQTVYPGMLIGTGISHGFGGKGEAALGLCLDYVTGMPYIPGSSVKGALRSAFAHPEYIKKLLNDAQVENADSLDVNELEAQMFGNPLKGKQYDVKNSEKDTFYDAIVVSEGKLLATDAITPHRQNPDLLELAAPNPITMIRIRPDVKFRFQFCLKESCGVTPEQKLRIFMKILLDLGIGAKTNVGYGSFVDPFVCPLCGGKKGANHPTCQKCSTR